MPCIKVWQQAVVQTSSVSLLPRASVAQFSLNEAFRTKRLQTLLCTISTGRAKARHQPSGATNTMGCQALAVTVLLGLLALVAGTQECTTALDSSSRMVGAKWLSSFQIYSQETQWKIKGDLTKINMYYSPTEGCVRGIKPTYGYMAGDALRLGTEGDDSGPYFANDISLQAGEYIVSAELRYTSTCIHYLMFATNKNRQLSIGTSRSTDTLLASAPMGTTEPDGTTLTTRFLGFIKGYTDVPNTDAKAGKLQQLQFVWATRTCPVSAPSTSPVPTQPTPIPTPPVVNPPSPSPVVPPVTVPSPSPVVQPSPIIIAVPSPSPPPAATPAVCLPSTKMGCIGGKCPTMTCGLSGLGMDVLGMFCFGVNTPKTLVDMFGLDFCKYLACKLDRPNCTSVGLLGLGGYCTGKITAVWPTAKLHSVGRSMLGFPCIEHTGPVLDLLPVISNTAKGVYMSKAWKACDCNKGLEKLITGITSTLHVPELPALPTNISLIPMDAKLDLLKSVFNVSVVQATRADVAAQWLTAAAAEMPLPKVAINASNIKLLQAILPDFQVPSILVPSVAFSLFKAPEGLTLPVLKVSDDLLPKVTQVVGNLTTLATAVIPDDMSFKMPDVDALIPDFSHVTLVGLSDLAEQFVDKLPEMPAINLAMTGNMSDLLAQWVHAHFEDIELPKITVNGIKLNALKAFIPGLTVPSIIIPNISFPLFQKPANLTWPVFKIPDKTLASISLLLPKLTALPTLLLPNQTVVLPELHLFNVSSTAVKTIIANMQGVQLSTALNLKLQGLTLKDAVTQWVAAIEDDLPMPQLSLNDTMMTALQTLVPGLELPAILVPNISSVLLSLPKEVTIPTFVIPTISLGAVSKLLPDLTSLATAVFPASAGTISLPQLSIHNITVANLNNIATALGVKLTSTTIVGLPSMPSLPSLLSLNTTALSSFIKVLQSGVAFPLFDPVKLITNLAVAKWQAVANGFEAIIRLVSGGTDADDAAEEVIPADFDAILNGTIEALPGETEDAPDSSTTPPTVPDTTDDEYDTTPPADDYDTPVNTPPADGNPTTPPVSPSPSPTSSPSPNPTPSPTPSPSPSPTSSPSPNPTPSPTPPADVIDEAALGLSADEGLAGDASTAFLSKADWEVLSPEDQKYMLDLVAQ